MKRFLINLSTNWCGEDQDYSAWAEDEFELEAHANLDVHSYDNFDSFGGFEAMLEEMYGTSDRDELTDEQITEAENNEGSYYSYTIEPWDEDRDEEEWKWYELIYDGREKKEENAI